MALVNFKMDKVSPEFRQGFLAALAFFDGVAQGDKTISHDFTTKDMTETGITFSDGTGEDNVTYEFTKTGKLKEVCMGVER